VLVRDIAFNSHCEHHMMPFMGKAHIAYKPIDEIDLSPEQRDLLRGALFFKPDRTAGGLEQIAQPLGKSHHAFEVSWDDYRAAMVRDKRVILRMTIDTAGPDQTG
jgi:hypothetical protein